SSERQEPDADLLETVASLGAQIGGYLERRRAQDAAQAADARRRAMLDAALDCVVTMDAQGVIVDANPATERTFGIPAAELTRRERVFSAVTEEVGRLLGAQTSNMVRFLGDGTADVVGAWHAQGARSVPVGESVTLDGQTVASRIARSGQPERVDSYAGLGGEL